MNSSTNPKILCIALSGIGNFIMQSPIFEALKQRYPESQLDVWVAPRGTRALAENNKHIGNAIEAPIKTSIRNHFRTLSRIRSGRYDIGIALFPGQHWKSAGYLKLAGIPTRIGYTYPFRANPKSSFLLTNAIDEKPELHDIEQNVRLLEPLGIKADESQITNYKLQIEEEKKSQARERLGNLNLDPKKILIGFHMGCAPSMLFKRWPLERFVELGRKLITHHNAHIVLFGGPDEADLKKTVQQSLGQENSSIIDTNLLTTAAMMTHCQLVISNDSGLMHVAAATGTTTLGLFGPTSEHRTGPRGSHSYVVRAPGTKPTFHVDKNFNLGTEPDETMQAITVDHVFTKINKIF